MRLPVPEPDTNSHSVWGGPGAVNARQGPFGRPAQHRRSVPEGVHVSIVGTGMGWTIAEADADIALHGRKLRGCFETSGNEEPPRLQRI